ncbi:MAG: hypothetical protein J6Q27_01430 [Clostridia bacterium]|nr:hypothetical protein [Clostridia bacterium]
MKNKWMIPVVLFVVLVVCYIVRGVFQTRVTVEMLQTDKIEQSSSGLGILIKNEKVHTFSATGLAEVFVENGQRVSNRQLIATLYGGTTDESVKVKLAEVNKKIQAIQNSNSQDGVFINDAAKIESELALYIDDVIAKVANRDLESISEYKYRISTLADQKAVAKGEKENFSDDLTKLQAEKSVLEAKLGKIEQVVTASCPGIFIEGSDGFEEKLTPAGIVSMEPNAVDEMIRLHKNAEIPKQDENTYTYKIVNNYSYYVAVNVEERVSGDVAVGDSVKVRFSDFSDRDCPAVVRHVSEINEKGIRTVVVECNLEVNGLLQKRVINVDFVKKSVSGYKVRVEHLHTVDNAVGLFIKRGAVMKFIPVNIVYSTEEEAIVSSATEGKPIKPYDEVVIAAPEYYDGKVIVSQ